MIELKNINIKFNRPVFENTGLILYRGKLNVLIGKSGIGKTTLFNELGLINNQLSCDYYFDGTYINDIDDKNSIRKEKIGYVFQQNELFQKLTVEENIRFAANLSGLDITEKEIHDLLKLTRVDALYGRTIEGLSGGEKQRLAVAFAMAKKPDLLLLDEPTSYLDTNNCKQLIDAVKSIVKETNTIVFIATHDHRIIDAAENIYTIKDHKIDFNIQDCKEVSENNIIRKKELSNRAKNEYIHNAKKKINKFIYILFSLVLTIILINLNYVKGYKEYVVNNIINNPMEEIRVYYGEQRERSADTITEHLSEQTVNRLLKIKGIEELLPFYQEKIMINGSMAAVQSYIDLGSSIGKEFKTGTNIYISSSLTEELNHNEISFEYNQKNYKYDVEGILESNHLNKYGDDEKVIYMPLSTMKKTFNETQENALLYIFKFNDLINLSTFENDIKNIDNNLTVYSTIPLKEVYTFNQSLVSGVEYLVAIIFICLIIFISYDYFQLLKSRKKEFGLLNANGCSKRNLIEILLKESFMFVFILTCIAVIVSSAVSYFAFGILYVTKMLEIAFVYILAISMIPCIEFVVIYKNSSALDMMKEE